MQCFSQEGTSKVQLTGTEVSGAANSIPACPSPSPQSVQCAVCRNVMPHSGSTTQTKGTFSVHVRLWCVENSEISNRPLILYLVGLRSDYNGLLGERKVPQLQSRHQSQRHNLTVCQPVTIQSQINNVGLLSYNTKISISYTVSF